MLDLKFVRENIDLIKADLEKRGDAEKKAWVDDIVQLDKKYRELLKESQELRHRRNQLSEEINKAKKEGKEPTKLLEEAKEIPSKLQQAETQIEGLLNGISVKAERLPNILHESVPVGRDDSDNVEIEKVGEKPSFDFTTLIRTPSRHWGFP